MISSLCKYTTETHSTLKVSVIHPARRRMVKAWVWHQGALASAGQLALLMNLTQSGHHASTQDTYCLDSLYMTSSMLCVHYYSITRTNKILQKCTITVSFQRRCHPHICTVMQNETYLGTKKCVLQNKLHNCAHTAQILLMPSHSADIRWLIDTKVYNRILQLQQQYKRATD